MIEAWWAPDLLANLAAWLSVNSHGTAHPISTQVLMHVRVHAYAYVYVYRMLMQGDCEDRELVTPPLDGTILPGITRDSILQLCKEWGEFSVSERQLSIKEIKQVIQLWHSEAQHLEPDPAFPGYAACMTCCKHCCKWLKMKYANAHRWMSTGTWCDLTWSSLSSCQLQSPSCIKARDRHKAYLHSSRHLETGACWKCLAAAQLASFSLSRHSYEQMGRSSQFRLT